MKIEQIRIENKVISSYPIEDLWPKSDAKNMKFILRSAGLVWYLISKNQWVLSNRCGVYGVDQCLHLVPEVIDLCRNGKLEDYHSFRKIWSPALIFKQIHGMTSGHLARVFNLEGPCYTLSESVNAIEFLVEQIDLDFAEERIDQAILFFSNANNHFNPTADKDDSTYSMIDESAVVALVEKRGDISAIRSSSLAFIFAQTKESLSQC